ncbi:MAG: exosortase/archaeosortase family protein [Nitrososphaerota archaeon]|nr:exosortase/archaeosortase family protein [Nitrososphaerota archaeon]
MSRPRPNLAAYMPLLAATAFTAALYFGQVSLLASKLGEVLVGVFDTSVPAFPLAGMLFVLIFIGMRRAEFEGLLAERRRDAPVSVASLAMALIPLGATFVFGKQVDSYAFAGLALATCWAGLVVAIRPATLRFLVPYLGLYLLAVSSVGILTGAFGDPLAVVVASISQGITSFFHVPVQWSSLNISFFAPGGGAVFLYISQECSGIASISIFILLMGLMHLDVKPKIRVTAAFAVGGFFLFIFLNSLRVVALIVAGVYSGVDLMWNLHGWLGYVLYIFGYSLIVILYFRSKRGESLHAKAGPGTPVPAVPQQSFDVPSVVEGDVGQVEGDPGVEQRALAPHDEHQASVG